MKIRAGRLLTLACLLLPVIAVARVGGGQSFSGGHDGGGGGGDIGFILQLLWWLLELCIDYPAIGIPLVILIIVWIWWASKNSDKPKPYSSAAPVAEAPSTVPSSLARLVKYDPNFSEISFNDFIYALYGKVHEARGRGDLLDYTSYAAESALKNLGPVPPEIKDVTGVIVGAASIDDVTDPDVADTVTIEVTFEANYTEVAADGAENAYYVVEYWSFERRRDVLSPKPDQITALHCPKCGGGLEKTDDGRCKYCGVKIVGGDFAWYVTDIDVDKKESRGPLLTSDVPEEGTDLPTVYQRDYKLALISFGTKNPDFSKERTENRFKTIFLELQKAWSTLNWEVARPYETDCIFQMHRYWIEAYKAQNLRNVLDQIEIGSIEPVKVQSDTFYDAITVRIFASMLDYTVDSAGKVVCGSNSKPRSFSEYWTFIRGRGAKENANDPKTCPNCGAPLSVSMAGVCSHCGGKITTGEFDWVLSKIEQDESYGR